MKDLISRAALLKKAQALESFDGKEVVWVRDDVWHAPSIDPVHTAGACYCKECKHAYINSFAKTQKSALCKYWTDRSGGTQVIMPEDGFCSYGETGLKPCPFCGGKAHTQGRGHETCEYRVYCTECGCSTPLWSQTKEKAVEVWDRRI